MKKPVKKPVKKCRVKKIAEMLVKSKKKYTRKDLRKLKGQFCGIHDQGPLFWFKDRSVVCLLGNGHVARCL